MANTKVIEAKIDELIPDDLNANNGTEYGKHLMNQSFERFGAWRSIAADRNLKIAAGNKSLENFAEAGFEDIIIVPTNGKQLVVVQRTDIDSTTPEGEKMFREYGIADNATSKANLSWDEENLATIKENWGVDAQDWGVKLPELEQPEDESQPKKAISTQLIVECGDVVKLESLFDELQTRGFNCELK